MHLTWAVDPASVKEDALGRGRFTGVNVSDDADIPGTVQERLGIGS